MHTAFAKIAKLAAMKGKEYHTESDILMNDSKFNIGQKVRRMGDTVLKVEDVFWSVLEKSWVYGVREPGSPGIYWPEVLEEDLLPL